MRGDKNVRALQCYAKGDEKGWEALCVDLDIAVEGRSFEDVRVNLGDAVNSYMLDARREEPRTAARLMRRRAPWWVSLGRRVEYVFHGFHPRDDGSLRAGFDLPCPA